MLKENKKKLLNILWLSKKHTQRLNVIMNKVFPILNPPNVIPVAVFAFGHDSRFDDLPHIEYFIIIKIKSDWLYSNFRYFKSINSTLNEYCTCSFEVFNNIRQSVAFMPN